MTYGHIRQELLSAFILTLIFTVLVSSFLISEGHSVYQFINPMLETFGLKDCIVADKEDPKANPSENYYEMVLLGFFRESSSFLQGIINRHSKSMAHRILVIDFNPEAQKKLIELGVHCVYGDISNDSTLKNLQLENAKVMICTVPDHNLKGTTNLNLLKALKTMYPNSKIIVTAETIESARKMYETGADYVFIPRLISAHYLCDVIDRMSLGEGAVIRNDAHSFIKSWEEVLD